MGSDNNKYAEVNAKEIQSDATRDICCLRWSKVVEVERRKLMCLITLALGSATSTPGRPSCSRKGAPGGCADKSLGALASTASSASSTAALHVAVDFTSILHILKHDSNGKSTISRSLSIAMYANTHQNRLP